MERIRFIPNVPQQLSLKEREGRVVPGRWGEQVVYTARDGRLLSVSKDVASKINLLEIEANEPFCICKRWNGERKQPPRWDIWLTPQAEKVRALKEMGPPETDLEEQLRSSIAQITRSDLPSIPKLDDTPCRPETERAESNGCKIERFQETRNMGAEQTHSESNPAVSEDTSATFPWTQILQSQTQALADVYAACIKYASAQHGNAVKPEDIRALMTTAFINLAQRGRFRAT